MLSVAMRYIERQIVWGRHTDRLTDRQWSARCVQRERERHISTHKQIQKVRHAGLDYVEREMCVSEGKVLEGGGIELKLDIEGGRSLHWGEEIKI